MYILRLDGKELMKSGLGNFSRNASELYSSLSHEEKKGLEEPNCSIASNTMNTTRQADKIFKCIHKKVLGTRMVSIASYYFSLLCFIL